MLVDPARLFHVVYVSIRHALLLCADLIQTIQVVDESCPEGVALCIFGKDVAAMPRAQLGDILELQNIIVSMSRAAK